MPRPPPRSSKPRRVELHWHTPKGIEVETLELTPGRRAIVGNKGRLHPGGL